MVSIEIVSEEGDMVTVLFKDSDRALLNAVRRNLMGHIPKMAIDSVRFQMGTYDQCSKCEHLNPAGVARRSAGGTGCSKCGVAFEKEGDDYIVWETNSAIPDEMIAQRMAMIPIPTNPEAYSFEEDCPDCKDLVEEDRGCPTCNMIYTLRAFGSKEGRDITARDLTFLGDDSGNVPEAYRDIPITRLFEGQMLELWATARMGYGVHHAKWSPVAGVSFFPRQIATIANEKKAKLLFDLGLRVSKKDFKSGQLKDISKIMDLKKDLHNVGAGTGMSESFDDAIKLEDVGGEFILSFETDGSMTPIEALNASFAKLSQRFNAIKDDIEHVLA